jgi:transcriptional regulator with XRE-family HTH domain
MDLQTWMTNQKLTDQKLADKLGFTRPYITRVRAGQVNPTLVSALKLVDYSKGEIDIRQLLPISLRPKLKRQPKATGTSRKPAASKASPEPADA